MREGVCRTLLLLLTAATSVQGNMRAPAFGKLRWGQDQNNLFVTAYLPGVPVHDEKQEFMINSSHFALEATDPATSEVYKIGFEFREDVNSSAVSIRHTTWKYGNKNNSLLAVIRKSEPGHLYDRLYSQKPDKKLKFAIEKDWDRFTVSDDMMEPDDEDEDGESDGVVRLNDKNFKSKTAEHDLSVFRVYYPWCDKCKQHKDFEKAVRSKRGRRLSKKYKILFGTVDAREEPLIRRLVSARCEDEDETHSEQCEDYLYTVSSSPGSVPVRWSGNDFSLAKTVKKMGSVPRRLENLKQLRELQQDVRETVTVVGLFDRSKHAQEAEVFDAMAQEKREEFLFASFDEASLIGSTVNEVIAKLLPDECAPQPTPEAPAMLLLKNFSKAKEDDGYAIFSDTKEAWSQDTLEQFINTHKDSKLTRENSGTVNRPKDTTEGRTVVRLFVADRKAAPVALDTMRCVQSMMHREATFIYHDEAAETNKPVIGSNMSSSTHTALLDYGLADTPRPLLVLDQLAPDNTIKHYALSFQNSAKYVAKQVRRAMAGGIMEAVRSEPRAAPLVVNKPGVVVGLTLGETVARGSSLLQLHSSEQKSLTALDADKFAQALQHVGAELLIGSMDVSLNKCNATDSRLPNNFMEVTGGCNQNMLVLLPEGGEAIKYSAINYQASPLLQFVHDHLPHKFDILKAQERVKELDQQCAVTVYQHGARNGVASVFRVGNYTLEEMEAGGCLNDDVSSVTVPEGCQVTLYENGDFTGWNATFEPGYYDVGQLENAGAKNDQTSSLIVSVYVRPDPPVQSAAPETALSPEGDVTITWPKEPAAEGVAQPDNYEVHTKQTKNPQGVPPENQPTNLLSSLLTEDSATQSYTLAYNSSTLSRGAEYVFFIKPVSTKSGPGHLSPPSLPVLIPQAPPTTEDEAAAVKDEV